MERRRWSGRWRRRLGTEAEKRDSGGGRRGVDGRARVVDGLGGVVAARVVGVRRDTTGGVGRPTLAIRGALFEIARFT